MTTTTPDTMLATEMQWCELAASVEGWGIVHARLEAACIDDHNHTTPEEVDLTGQQDPTAWAVDHPAVMGVLQAHGFTAGWLYSVRRIVRETTTTFVALSRLPDGRMDATPNERTASRAIIIAAVRRGSWL